MARADFRQAMALVPQDPVIFATSARENIRFGRPDATDAEVEEAAKAAAAHEGLAVAALVARIDAERIKSPTPPGLASAIRVWLVGQLHPPTA